MAFDKSMSPAVAHAAARAFTDSPVYPEKVIAVPTSSVTLRTASKFRSLSRNTAASRSARSSRSRSVSGSVSEIGRLPTLMPVGE